jgi:quercetin dioxygenase-like cupin family protein
MATQRGHTYKRTHRLAGPALTFDIAAEDRALRERAATARSGRAAKTLVKEGRLRVTLIALTRGAALSGHSVDAAVSIQVLRGRVSFDVDGRSVDLRQGGVLVLDEGTPHSATAAADSGILLTTAMAS